MVRALHRAGIEVILDVVDNHSAEGKEDGPTLCFRGLTNENYYILMEDKSRYADYTGCGNTLNANEPIVRRLWSRRHKSPGLLTGGLAGTSGTTSAGSSARSGVSSIEAIRRSISAQLEAGDLEAEIEVEQREILQLPCQQPVVPDRDLGKPVIGDHKGASPGWGQMIDAHRRRLGHAECAGGQDPAVTGNYPSVAINENRDDETENLMLSAICRICSCYTSAGSPDRA